MTMYNVYLQAQSTNMSCWVTGIAMILGWRDNMTYDHVSLASSIGYSGALNTGLNPNDSKALRDCGFVPETPQSYVEDSFDAMLMKYGPIWVAGAQNPIVHIRVVTGLENHRVYINDPWPPGAGRQYDISYEKFCGEVSGLAFMEMAQPTPIYVAHLP